MYCTVILKFISLLAYIHAEDVVGNYKGDYKAAYQVSHYAFFKECHMKQIEIFESEETNSNDLNCEQFWTLKGKDKSKLDKLILGITYTSSEINIKLFLNEFFAQNVEGTIRLINRYHDGFSKPLQRQ
ncbi:unnamed protein product [Schistosoma turkestanicum]|nr:unnamed protein product [Schistosoma turkestanicum]